MLIELVPPASLLAAAQVLTFGANKYGRRNWEVHADQWHYGQLLGSTLRHLLAWMFGVERDAESGLHHLAHAFTDLMMLYALVVNSKGVDDRTHLRAESDQLYPQDLVLNVTEPVQ